MSTSVGRLVRRWTAATLVGLAGAVGTADAVVYVASWDPLFNTNLDGDFAWKGSATVNISNSCLALTDGVYAVPGSCPAASLIAVSLSFYDNDNNSAAGTLAFGPTFPAIANVRITGGALDGIDTDAQLTSTPFTNDLLPGTYTLRLDFTLDAPVLTLEVSCDFGECPTYSSAGPGGGGVENFTWRVPEPTTLALLGAAIAGLGVSGFSRRS